MADADAPPAAGETEGLLQQTGDGADGADGAAADEAEKGPSMTSKLIDQYDDSSDEEVWLLKFWPAGNETVTVCHHRRP